MPAYYNEIDAKKAAWLRELIKAGAIAPGDVDERSITDVRPCDLVGYAQCHFFAGVGVWSYALRLAGWPDDREVWTGSCPCQPFSAAGKKKGAGDERHLWPEWFRLIRECRPGTLFGEQVAAATVVGHANGKADRKPKAPDGPAWFDAVSDDLESASYTRGAVDIPAAGFGAPHIRQRLYFVADTADARCNDTRQYGSGPSLLTARPIECGAVGGLVDTSGARPPLCECEALQRAGRRVEGRTTEQPGRSPAVEFGCDKEHQWPGPTNSHWRDADWLRCTDDKWRPVETGTFPLAHGAPARVGRLRGYGDANGGHPCTEREQRSGQHGQQPQDGGVSWLAHADDAERRAEMAGGHDSDRGAAGRNEGYGQPGERREVSRPGPTNGFWGLVDWLFCTDGKWRPVETGTFPLAHGAPARVGRLRGYGDAIVAQVAAGFIRAYMEAEH